MIPSVDAVGCRRSGTAIETQSPSGVPSTQSCTWSIAALAAEAALDAPRASMIAAPRLPTVGMKSFSSQSWSWPDGLPGVAARRPWR